MPSTRPRSSDTDGPTQIISQPGVALFSDRARAESKLGSGLQSVPTQGDSHEASREEQGGAGLRDDGEPIGSIEGRYLVHATEAPRVEKGRDDLVLDISEISARPSHATGAAVGVNDSEIRAVGRIGLDGGAQGAGEQLAGAQRSGPAEGIADGREQETALAGYCDRGIESSVRRHIEAAELRQGRGGSRSLES